MKDFENYKPPYNSCDYYRSYYDNNYESQNILSREKKNVQVKTGFKFTKYDWHNEEIIKLIKSKKKYVTEGIGTDYFSWERGTATIISAQTGAGKNFFVENELIKYAIKMGWKIIIFLNRSALALQVKRNVAKIQGIDFPNDYTPRELNEREVFGCVTIKTYQKLIADMNNSPLLDRTNGKLLDQDYDICVFDECHYYVNDSGLTSQSYILIQYLRSWLHYSIRLYITSTPNEVMPWIIEVEKKNQILERSLRISNPVISSLCPNTIRCWEFKRDYKYVIPRYFKGIKQITKRILDDKTDEKWIIYVRSKTEGKEIVEVLGEEVAAFIDASSKEASGLNNDIFDEIIKKEKFSIKVLVTTTVLDNGVNIKDPKLKNIIIMTTNETAFIQTLGRKRKSYDGEKINLYIQKLESTQISYIINSIQDQLDAYDVFNESDIKFKNEYLTNDLDVNEKIRKIFYFKNSKEIVWNPIAIKKLNDDKRRLEEVTNKILGGDGDAFIKLQLSWIGLEKTFDKINYIDNKQQEDYKNEILEFIESIVDKPLNKEEQEKLTWDFKDKCIKAYGKRKGKDGKNIDRHDRGYGIDVINNILESHKLSYVLSSSDGFWVFKKNNLIGEN